MLENIKSKLQDYLLPLGITQTPSRSNIAKKISTIKNTPHPNKSFGTGNPKIRKSHTQPPMNTSKDNQISGSVASIKNPGTEKADALTNTQALTAPTAEVAAQQVKNDHEVMEFIGLGSRGKVYRNGDTVTKIVKPKNSSIESHLSTQKQLRHEVAMCNKYWQQKNGSLPATLKGNQITMPFIEGAPPELAEISGAIQDLHAKGFMMADAARLNFIKSKNGEIVPVDFGLLFMDNDIKNLDKQVKIEIVHDFIKGGYKYIPAELKPQYTACIQGLDKSLMESSPANTMNTHVLSHAGLLYSSS